MLIQSNIRKSIWQHSIKGSEFDNVIVVLDNGNWNSYNFEKLFIHLDSSISIVTRTRKLFYVCITRSKNNLVVNMPNAKDSIIDTAVKLFGKSNMYKV